LGIMVMPDFFFKLSGFLRGCKMLLTKSPKSYCLYNVSTTRTRLDCILRNESAFNESTGATCAKLTLCQTISKQNNRTLPTKSLLLITTTSLLKTKKFDDSTLFNSLLELHLNANCLMG